jgi:hypothetical protein
MDRISIKNIFANSNDFEPLDVNNLYSVKDKKNKINFNIDRLIKLREERKNKILIQYEKIFKMCLNKINLANDMNKTEIVYDVPDGIFGHNDYNPVDCLLYVEEKLKNMFFDTLILNNKTIFISWANLGENREKNKN